LGRFLAELKIFPAWQRTFLIKLETSAAGLGTFIDRQGRFAAKLGRFLAEP
jgi:hypothetical protein